jgi:hypothetical protein
VRCPALAVVVVDHLERAEIHLRDRVDHEPRQMPLRQPLAQTRRQQQLLITITREKVLRHPAMVLTTADGAALYATASMEGGTPMTLSAELRWQAIATVRNPPLHVEVGR